MRRGGDNWGHFLQFFWLLKWKFVYILKNGFISFPELNSVQKILFFHYFINTNLIFWSFSSPMVNYINVGICEKLVSKFTKTMTNQFHLNKQCENSKIWCSKKLKTQYFEKVLRRGHCVAEGTLGLLIFYS